MRITTILNSPFPFKTDKKEILLSSLFFGVFVFFFILIFRSDFFNTHSIPTRVLYSFYYFLIVAIGMIINGVINYYTTSQKSIDNWTVRQEIGAYVIHTLTIAISVFYLSNLLHLTQLSIANYVFAVFITFVVGIIPLTIYTLIRFNILLRTHLKDMQTIKDELSRPKLENINLSKTIEINNNIIAIEKILAIESVGNYVMIRLKEGEIKYRCTIKQMEEILDSYPKFIRCHRAFIINTDKIRNVEGNSQGLRLFVENSNNYIPVSRANIPKLKSTIQIQ